MGTWDIHARHLKLSWYRAIFLGILDTKDWDKYLSSFAMRRLIRRVYGNIWGEEYEYETGIAFPPAA